MDQAHPVRQATRADLESLVALEDASFTSDRIGPRQWRRHVDSPSTRVLVCGPIGDLAAAAVVFYRRNARVARLYSLAVRPALRGHGFAGALLAGVELDARRRGCHTLVLEVRADNPAAIALYERRGYRRTARLAAFYEDGADGWRYTRALTTVTP